jgi:hypothetical protein
MCWAFLNAVVNFIFHQARGISYLLAEQSLGKGAVLLRGLATEAQCLIVTFPAMYPSGLILLIKKKWFEKNEMGGACSACEGGERLTGFWRGDLRERTTGETQA